MPSELALPIPTASNRPPAPKATRFQEWLQTCRVGDVLQFGPHDETCDAVDRAVLEASSTLHGSVATASVAVDRLTFKGARRRDIFNLKIELKPSKDGVVCIATVDHILPCEMI
ncbi:MAG: hypothetical protein AAB131_23445 [Actinomycetota bacterium]